MSKQLPKKVRNDRNSYLPRPSPKVSLQHWGIYLSPIGLAYPKNFSVKQDILKGCPFFSWQCLAVIFFCILLIQLGQHTVSSKGKNSWLLCFSDLQVEPQYLSLGFYYLYYIWCPRLGYEFMKKLFASGFTDISIGQSYMRLESLSHWLCFSFVFGSEELSLNPLLELLPN